MKKRLLFIILIVSSIIAKAGDPDLFYFVADGNDRLYSVDRVTGTVTDIGATGVTNIEAIAYYPIPGANQLFAANNGEFGTINISTGAYTAIGDIDAAGSMNGPLGAKPVTDVDAMMLDGQTFKLWAAQRNSPNDLLFQIDPVTGLVVRSAFGPGVDYIVVSGPGINVDVDDIAIDPTSGRMYAANNDGGTNDNLIEINKFNAVYTILTALSEDDVEGTSFHNDGTMYGSEGDADRMSEINLVTGAMTNQITLAGGDVEALAALVADANTVSGTVYNDDDLDGILDGGETGVAGVTVYLYIDVDNDGLIDPEDLRVQTTTTDVNGDYSFYYASTANLLVTTEFTSYPASSALTTDNIESASFTDNVNFAEVDANNNFGIGTGPDCDGDGLPNFFEGGNDSDFDSVADSCDLDSDNDGILDSVEGIQDFDNDGLPNYTDRDSDDDGIPDAIEGNQGTAPTGYSASNGNVSGTDADGNGIVDAIETSSGSGVMIAPVPDSDNDGKVDYLDLDSDNDGILDILEAGGEDSDSDGQVDGLLDANSNGLDDRIEATPLLVPNTDATFETTNGLTLLPNYIDIDSDSDGIDDTREAYSTADYDFPTLLSDIDSDGIVDFWDVSTFAQPIIPYDRDSDDIPDYLDSDSDNDGISDLIEGNDLDGDGVVDVVLSGLDDDNNGLDDALDDNCGEQTVYATTSGYGEERVTDGVMDLASTDLELCTDIDADDQQIVGIRFSNVGVDQGANITSAFVQFEVDETTSGSITITIEGELDPDAAAFTTTDDDISNRTRTSASKTWSPGDWVQVNETGTDQRTVNIATIIQEIVSQGTWANGNSLVLIFSGAKGNARIAENDPLLIINTEFDATPTLSFTAGDFAEENNSTGSVDLTSGDLELPNDGSTNQTVGVLFSGVTLEQGQIVNSAYLQFEADEVQTGAITISIEGELESTSDLFTTTVNDVTSRTTTTSSAISWSPSDWNTVGEAGAAQQTPDISTLIQEIVNQPGWVAGNNMTFIITGTSGSVRRTAEVDPTLVLETNASFSICASSVAVQDFDGDGESDFRDTDDDADGIPTSAEPTDDDLSGTVDYLESDTSSCGLGFISTTSTTTVPATIYALTGSGDAQNPDRAEGSPDGSISEVDDGEELILDFGTTIKAGDQYTITWQLKNGGSSETIFLDESTDDVSYTANTSVSTASATFITSTVTAGIDFQYLKIRKPGTVEVAEIDAVEASSSAATSTVYGVTGSGTSANPDRAEGAPNTDFSQIDDGEELILDFNQTISAGDQYTITWQLRNGGTSETIFLDESTDDVTYTANTSVSTSSATFITSTVTAGISFRYLKIRKPGTVERAEIDAVEAVRSSSITTTTCSEDNDNDGIADTDDIDDDNDGVLDVNEGEGSNNPVGDEDGDGTLNFEDVTDDGNGGDGSTTDYTDTNGDGIPDVFDNDSDGIPNHLDLDSDNDGIADILEAGGTDNDADGRVDDPEDTDGDGWANVFDSNDGGTALTDGDKDGDGIENRLDLDADNDGIADIIEAGGEDADGDGRADDDTDTDNDGFADLFDSDNLGTPLPNKDVDGDGLENYLDLDSDNDGIIDNIESQTTAAFLAPLGTDTDGDGWDDRYDSDDGGTAITISNKEGFGQPDYLDDDSDGDGVVDWIEGFDDNEDGDALVDFLNRADAYETAASNPSDYVSTLDTDGDDLPDFLEDDDSDNVPNFLDPDSGFYHDDDNDGLINLYDTDNFGTANSTPTSLSNFDADAEPDFRDSDTEITLVETDNDDDGIIDSIDLDDDNDGVLDTDEGTGSNNPAGDEDGDGIPNYKDVTDDGDTGDGSTTDYTDTNGDGIPDVFDTDGDGVPNLFDLDSDNDGIPDIVEAGGEDTDGNGKVDDINADGTLTADTDNDGLADVYDDDNGGTAIANPDTDGDGIDDHQDLDSDNDGIPDVVEAGGTDENGDGRADDFVDTDDDGFNDVVDGDVGQDGTSENTANALLVTGADTGTDGVPDSYPNDDNDGDGVINSKDLDADNDGIPDVVEAGGTDENGDGRADDFVDADSDGFNDIVDGDPTNALAVGSDAAGANTGDALTVTGADTDNDGAPNSYPSDDFDGDNVYNFLDLDADDDGILDVTEAGGADTNRDGQEDSFVDADGDGFNDNVDGDIDNSLAVGDDTDGGEQSNATTLTDEDADLDGVPDDYPNDDFDDDGLLNYLDIDADNDGIVDNTEGQGTATYVAPANADADGDGIDDAYDADDANFGGAGSSFVLSDIDNATDANSPDYLDLDSDGDGALDTVEGHDTDNDGIADGGSPANTGLPGGTTDTDGDGLLDGYDNNTASVDPTNTNLQGTSHPNLDNTTTTEADWREILDNDNDGITDADDLDDDNDGILDTDECSSIASGPSGPVVASLGTSGGLVLINDGDLTADNGIGLNSTGEYIVVDLGTNIPAGVDVVFTLWDSNDDNKTLRFAELPNSSPNLGGGSNPSTIDDVAIATGASVTSFTYTLSAITRYVQVEMTSRNGGRIEVIEATVGAYSDCTLDTDGDGVPNLFDLDSDNDGIPDIVEAGGEDTDGNGKVDDINADGTLTADTDNDGLADVYDDDNGGTAIVNPDTDGDGIDDHQDLDADNDGIPDVVEAGGTDENGDGRADDFVDTDDDGLNDVVDGDVGQDGTSENTANALLVTGADTGTDGVPDSYPNDDNDGDGVINSKDLDADNDGIPDVVEAGGTDENGDGRADDFVDADSDGFNDIVDGDPTNALAAGSDAAGANTGDALTVTGADTDNDGAPNSYPNDDTDGDGILDQYDLDADNDGIPDVVEAGGTDENGDGRADDYADIDGDGFNDVVDGDPLNTNPAGSDIVGINTPNALTVTDEDADLDGVPDSYPDDDADGDGILNALDLDADNDGIPDVVEAGGTDENGDGRADDYADADGDGFNDVVDGDPTNALAVGSDAAGANTGDALTVTGSDTDNDGAPNTYPNDDNDGDGILNQLDLDADNDGIPDVVEQGGTDENGDGRADDYVDADSDGFNDIVDGDPTNVLAVGSDAAGANTGDALTVTGSDTDNDGAPNTYPNDDTDGDDVYNFLDLDADNDGIPDVVEQGGTDENGDGRADNYVDADGDGFNDAVDGDPTNALAVGSDAAGANTGDALTATGADTDNDGAPNTKPNGEFDGDGVYNFLDLDADDDGILDVIEAGGIDAGRDGIADSYADADGDGFNDTVDGDSDNSLSAGDDSIEGDAANALTLTYLDGDGDGAPDSYPNDDFDADGLLNFLDIDADNDGIVDNTEGQSTAGYIAPDNADADGDGIDDAYDADDANFGGAGSSFVLSDIDNATDANSPDYLDIDSDGDGDLDTVEGHDTDNDGVADGSSPANTGLPGGTTDTDGDGLLDGYDNNTASVDPTNTNLQGTSHPNLDRTFTTERDWRESNDNDNDGIPDNVDIDDDNDGILDVDEANTANEANGDEDGDGILNFQDVVDDGAGDASTTDYTDANADGVPDAYDKDGDGIPDQFDLDADNDGIPDIVEAGGTDANNDGVVDVFADADNDGWATTFDNVGEAGTPLSDDDQDGDGLPNRLDLDADDDGLQDILEAGGVDADGDGMEDGGTDTDEDGWSNVFDSDDGGTALPVPDTDGDNLANYLDLDSDSDGIIDNIEWQTTGNFDAPISTDANNNGWDDEYDGNVEAISNNDAAGDPDYIDLNSDGDAQPDWLERADDDEDGDALLDLIALADAYEAANANPNHYPSGDDADSDGIPDFAEDADSDGLPNFLDPDNGAFYRDTDGDGLVDFYDADQNGDNRENVNQLGDFDSDGAPDFRDTDNDVTLPIQLIEFTAIKVGAYVQLDWSTATEINNDYFTIERSLDGVSFEEIITEFGAGNSSRRIDYRRYDESPEMGYNYYRLSQTDFNGVRESFNIEVVKFEGIGGVEFPSTMSLKVYPNPTEGRQLTLAIDELAAGRVQLEIMTPEGRRISRRALTIETRTTDYNVELLEGKQLAAGAYYLRVITQGKAEVLPFIVK